jgi:PEP-CTERM putative exosortase interaction domain
MSRFGSLTHLVLAFAVFGIISIAAGTAKADIVVITGVNNQGTDNVLLNPSTNVLTVTGTVGANNLLVNFTSTSGDHTLSANPSGQATVSGGTGNAPFTQLTFGLANNDTFTRAVFNINAAVNGMVTITVTGINITGGTFVQSFTVDANGENFFTVTAINGQLIQTVSLSGVQMDDVRQVRIGGGAVQNTVPEPASMFLLGSGLLGVAAGFRKRLRRK